MYNKTNSHKDISLKISNKVSVRIIDRGFVSLNELKEIGIRLIEIIVFLSLGLLLTMYILRPIYENFGIQFIGNVWVNWFGVAYIIFVLYTLIFSIYIFKDSIHFKQRLTSIPFWLVFVASSYVVLIPFIKGENPF